MSKKQILDLIAFIKVKGGGASYTVRNGVATILSLCGPALNWIPPVDEGIDNA